MVKVHEKKNSNSITNTVEYSGSNLHKEKQIVIVKTENFQELKALSNENKKISTPRQTEVDNHKVTVHKNKSSGKDTEETSSSSLFKEKKIFIVKAENFQELKELSDENKKIFMSRQTEMDNNMVTVHENKSSGKNAVENSGRIIEKPIIIVNTENLQGLKALSNTNKKIFTSSQTEKDYHMVTVHENEIPNSGMNTVDNLSSNLHKQKQIGIVKADNFQEWKALSNKKSFNEIKKSCKDEMDAEVHSNVSTIHDNKDSNSSKKLMENSSGVYHNDTKKNHSVIVKYKDLHNFKALSSENIPW